MNRFAVRDVLALAGVVIVAFAVGAISSSALRMQAAAAKLTADDWLLSAPSDRERFRRLQTQLRGFDQPMWEVGERFRRLHEALSRQNYDLALYHWQKIDTTIRNGIAKRPARAASAESLFLDRTFEEVRAGIRTRTPRNAWEAFAHAKVACQACHQAEGVPYINQQPLFDLAVPDGRTGDAAR